MASLEAPVVNGKIEIPETSQEDKKSRKTGSELGKEEFLQLLVTQMKYQDPLDPADNTEYVAQLAQFSELEQMQNLNQTTTNTSAFTLVGKEVYIVDRTLDTEREVQGTVEYVTVQNGTAYVSVDGTLYKYDDIVQVIDEAYLIESYLPSIPEQRVVYKHHDPQDVVVEGINLGSHGYEATSFAVAIMDDGGNTEAINTDFLSYSKGKLTISKAVFDGLESGTYTLAFVFNDANSTVRADKVTLEVKGIRKDTGNNNNGTDNTGTNGTDNTGDDNTQGV